MRRASFLLAILFLTSSCATVFSKSSYDLILNSEPSGAKFKILDQSGREVSRGTTPQTVKLSSSPGYFKKAEYQAVFSSSDGSRVILPITFHVDGWYIAGNIIFGGLVGWLLVDPLSGAMYTIDDEVITAYLGDNGKSASTNSRGLKIMTVDEYPGDKSELIRIGE